MSQEGVTRGSGESVTVTMCPDPAVTLSVMLLLIYTLWKNGEEYDPMRDKTHTPKKRMKEEDTELEYGPKDCIGPKHEPVDWNATDEHGNPPF